MGPPAVLGGLLGIKEYFYNTYTLYEKVFELLKSDEVFYKKSELTRHPMIFYFGHTKQNNSPIGY